MNKIEFVETINETTQYIAACFAQDHQYIMLLAAVEHKISLPDLAIVAEEYMDRPKEDKDVVVFTAWDTGVKNQGKFRDAVDMRIGARENQKRAKAGGMTIREELNDEIFAEFIESTQNYYNGIKYYNDRIDEGTSPALDKEKLKEVNAVIQGLYSEFNRMFGVTDA